MVSYRRLQAAVIGQGCPYQGVLVIIPAGAGAGFGLCRSSSYLEINTDKIEVESKPQTDGQVLQSQCLGRFPKAMMDA